MSLPAAKAQQLSPRARQFPPGSLARIEDLPAGRLRTRVESLPAAARQRALERLRSFHFTELDLESLEADDDGEMFYVDRFGFAPAAEPAEPVVAEAALPVAPFPASLVFHSKPGAPNLLYLNFSGENVSGTRWNTSLNRTFIPAVAFSTDSDFTTFSDSEQAVIKRVWQRVAEDYAPFDIDVTTERPSAFGSRTAHALITRSTDANSAANPSSSAGGVGYVNVFGSSSYGSYRPAWIYFNNLANSDVFIAAAASHEIGHNLGLSHDGLTDGTEYYNGHGSGNTSWGPIMGSASSRNVTQWSKGEYFHANNTQDDLAIISGKIPYRADDHGDTAGTATPLVITGTNIVSTTPEEDPRNSNPANKGMLERNTDVDVFSFTTGSGRINLLVKPWLSPAGARGGNLDVLLELRQSNGILIATNNAPDQTTAQIQTTLAAGSYRLHIRNTGVGNPTSSVPSGYTPYGTIGQYFISGFITATSGPVVQLIATANNPAWGAVSPTNATYPAGASVQLMAIPSTNYQFVRWTNGLSGTNNPQTLVLNSNVTVQALFAERLTSSHPTPYWWLSSYGYSDYENAVNTMGVNGLPVWQSYVAGLNPTDPKSQLRLTLSLGANNANVLRWSTVPGRRYTLWSRPNLSTVFSRVAGASNLPASTQSFTNQVTPSTRSVFYRLEVQQ